MVKAIAQQTCVNQGHFSACPSTVHATNWARTASEILVHVTTLLQTQKTIMQKAAYAICTCMPIFNGVIDGVIAIGLMISMSDH